MIAGVGSQLRLVTLPTPEGIVTRPIGLDFGAVMLVAQARGLDTRLIADVLPRIEAAIVSPADSDGRVAGDDVGDADEEAADGNA